MVTGALVKYNYYYLIAAKPPSMVIPARKVIDNIGTLLLVYSLALAREVNLFSSFFPLVIEKDEKTCFNAEKNDFGQKCTHWSKYTTTMLPDSCL